MGFETLVFSRLTDNDRIYRQKNKLMEFYWKPDFEPLRESESQQQPLRSSSPENQGLFTHILHQTYFRGLCGVDFERAFYNETQWYIDDVLQNKTKYVECLWQLASKYRTHELMMPFGWDFTYREAYKFYDFLDTLISQTNNSVYQVNSTYSAKFIVKYSRVNEYMKLAKEEISYKGIQLPVHTYDFFPYDGQYEGGHYWTGYFTSRSNLKMYIRKLSAQAALTDTLYTLQSLCYQQTSSNS